MTSPMRVFAGTGSLAAAVDSVLEFDVDVPAAWNGGACVIVHAFTTGGDIAYVRVRLCDISPELAAKVAVLADFETVTISWLTVGPVSVGRALAASYALGGARKIRVRYWRSAAAAAASVWWTWVDFISLGG